MFLVVLAEVVVFTSVVVLIILVVVVVFVVIFGVVDVWKVAFVVVVASQSSPLPYTKPAPQESQKSARRLRAEP